MNDQNQPGIDSASSDPEDAPDALGPGTRADLGGTFRRGMGWLGMSSFAIKVISFATQLWLAHLLAKDDFGLYAAALGIAGFVTAFRDGGVAMYLIRYGLRDYARLAAPVFWFALAVNMIGGLILCAGALVLWAFDSSIANLIDDADQLAYLDPQMPLMLLIIASSMPLGTLAAIQKAKLRLDLRFANLSGLVAASAIVRYIGAVTLAHLGFGALSFVWPILAMTLVETIWGQWATRDLSWCGRPQFGIWRRIIRDAKWLLFGTLGSVVYNLGAYSVAALFLAQGVLGVYFFAYQMTQNLAALLNVNLMNALAPTLVHLQDEADRLREASRRTLHVLMLLAAPISLGMGVTIDSFEQLVLGGEWDDAVRPIQIFGALSPLALSWGLTYSVLTSQGRFRGWAIATMLEGAIVTIAAGAGALVWDSAVGASLATALAIASTRLAITIYAMRTLGFGARAATLSLMPAWMIALVCAIPPLWLDGMLAGEPWPPLARFLLSGVFFAALYGVGVRVLLPTHVRDALTIVPGRFRGLASRVLLLPR